MHLHLILDAIIINFMKNSSSYFYYIKLKRVLLLITFLLAFNTIQSQDKYILKEISTNYKFQEDYVRKFYTDAGGMIWMRTASRILRFDGTTIKYFDDIIPPNFKLQDIYFIGNKILLNYNNDSLKLFDLNTLSLKDIPLPFNNIQINQIAYVNQNRIIFLSKSKKKAFECSLIGEILKVNKELNDLETDKIIPLNDSLFLLYHNVDIYRYNVNSKEKKLIIPQENISSYFIDDSTISMAMTGHFRRFNFLYNRFTIDIQKTEEESYNLSYIQNRLWLFSTEGIYNYDYNKVLLKKCQFVASKSEEEIVNNSYDISYQIDGDYYLLSSRKGLYKIVRNNLNTINQFQVSKMQDKDPVYRCIYYDEVKKELLLAREKIGISSFSIKGDSTIGKDTYASINYSRDQDKNFNKICRDKNKLWFLGNLKTRIIDNSLINNIDTISFWDAWDICSLNSELWLISRKIEANLVTCYNSNRIQIRQYSLPKENIHNQFWDIEPYKNFLLISSIEGLLAFDTLTKEFVDIHKAIPTKDDLKGRAWSSKVIEDMLYIAYQDRGLMKVDLKTGKFTFPVPAINKAFQIETFDGKSIWVNAQDRVVYLDKDDHYFVLKSSNFALPANIAFHGMYADSSGMLWVCGKGGFSRINSNQMIYNIRNANIKTILYDLTVNNKLVAGNIPSNSIFEFPYDSSSISLNVTNSLLDPNEDIKIKYKLLNYDADFWVTEATNNISYKKLPHGDYILQIFLCNSYGVWDEKPTLLTIHILPPWYLSTLALVIYVILGIAALIGLVLGTIYVLNTKKRREMVLIESEMKTLRAQLNPHFLFNSLNSVIGNIIESDTGTATNYINRFAKLIRKVLDFSETEAIIISDETKWIRDYLELESIRLHGRLIWNLILDPEIDPDTRIPTMITQPIIENAILHGIGPKSSEGFIQVGYTMNPDKKSITCIIHDNGVGRHLKNEKEKGHISKGSLITTKRMEHLSKKYEMNCTMVIDDLVDERGNALGTKVTLVLPIL